MPILLAHMKTTSRTDNLPVDLGSGFSALGAVFARGSSAKKIEIARNIKFPFI